MFEDAFFAKRQILKDKHTLLEGYVTEYLYENQFLARKPDQYTSGWWSAEVGGKRFFFVVKEKLNDVDCAVMRILSRQFICWRAFPQKEKWLFHNGDTHLDMSQFLAQFHLRKRGNSKLAEKETRDSVRQKRCVDFFERHQLLQKIAVERYFANDFLSVFFYSLVNIDYFVLRNNGQLTAIEVKFKFESENGKFGVNSGQYNLFTLLENNGFEVQHWILYNWTKDKELSIFGFLDEDMEKYWLYGQIRTDVPRVKKTAPKETSVHGSKSQGFYEFDKNEFEDSKPLLV